MTSEPGHIVVFAPNWLGDAVMALPAIADLRRQFATARVVLAVRSPVASLFELVAGVDAVVALQWRGQVLKTRPLHADLASLRGACDPARTIAMLLPNSFATAWLAGRVPFAERWGYARDWRSPLLTRAVALPRTSMHQGRYYQQLVAAVGVPNGPLEPSINVPETIRQHACEQLVTAGWDGRQPIVTMAPGAAYGTAKRWLPQHFAQVIARLAADQGARVVLVGSAADRETTGMITADPQVRAAGPIDLAGRTSLRELAGVIAISRACVSNDSGAMHLAGAIGTPIVALFGPTRDGETAPLTRAGGHRDVLINPVWCRPCMLRECPIDHRCMKGLEPSRVLTAIGAISGSPVVAQRTRQVDA